MVAPWNEVGGAVVALAFTCNSERFTPGRRITRAQFDAFKNARALVRAGYLKPFPPSDPSKAPAAGSAFVLHRGGGFYDVIVGERLNSQPLSKDEADALARGN
jgi:hypothetical protein